MSGNFSQDEILSAPGITKFMTFLVALIADGKATYSDKSNKVVLLNSDASNYFTLGRDNKNKPYIGLQEDMVPWFLDIPWDIVVLSLKEKYLYLVAKNEDGEPIFCLGIKPRRKRLLAINVPEYENVEDTKVSFKLFKIINREIAISQEKAQKKELSVAWEKSIFNIIEPEVVVEKPPVQENLSGFKFVNRKRKNND